MRKEGERGERAHLEWDARGGGCRRFSFFFFIFVLFCLSEHIIWRGGAAWFFFFFLAFPKDLIVEWDGCLLFFFW